MTSINKPASDCRQPKLQNSVADIRPDMRMLGDDELDGVAGALTWTIKPCYVPSYSMS
jgi:hypothetical protein